MPKRFCEGSNGRKSNTSRVQIGARLLSILGGILSFKRFVHAGSEKKNNVGVEKMLLRELLSVVVSKDDEV